MNALSVLFGGIVWLLLGYFIYGKWIRSRLFVALDTKETPAHEFEE